MKSSKYTGINPDPGLRKKLNLWNASRQGNIKKVKELLRDNGVDIDKQEENTGKTALIKAATAGHYAVVQFLCDKGANVHIKDAGAWEAEKYAVYHGQYHIAINLKRYWFNGLKLLTK